ncbi:MAG: membrane protein insertase YidC [candidate division Zixibacteria bacterium]|nr:membrane protein insertase YidC [candidate division Zixibacteria bacterium]
MDKRSIVGFLLILLILFLWPQWSNIFNPQQPNSGQDEQNQPIAESENHIDKTQTEDIHNYSEENTSNQKDIKAENKVSLNTIDLEPEKLIKVETENFIAVLSSHGGLLKSMQLKKYLTENGADGHSLVQLVSPPEISPWGANGALTLGVEDSLYSVNNIAYDVIGYNTTLLKGDEPQTVSFIYNDDNGSSIRKDFTFNPEGYSFKLRLTITNADAFGFDDELTLGWLNPTLTTEKDYKEDLSKNAGFYCMGGEVVESSDLKDGKLYHRPSGTSKWVAVRSKYFVNAIIADSQEGSQVLVVGTKDEILDAAGKPHEWKKFGVGLTFDIKDNSFSNDITVYTGPLDYYRLKDLGYNLSQLVEMGWKAFRPFAIGILWIFVQLHKILFNYGLVIIIFSIIMKIIFWPLTRKSSTSMMKMKELQPKIQEVKEKFKNDPKKLNAETMKVYKEFGVNPFGSCLPMLVQLPIFWAMFSVLRNSIEIRGAGFVFYLNDLSQKDPHYILPIIMGIAMFLQQKMTITDPKQKMLVYIMPVVFVFLFAGWPSGLVLYWTMFSVIGIFEQLIVKKRLDEEKRLATK